MNREGRRGPAVVVVGSVNMDLVAWVERLPRPGETVVGREFLQNPGGKGANQAVAAARLGAHTRLVGRVGADAFGEELRRGLRGHGVDVDLVQSADGCPSGVALIGVEDAGENAITVIPGANARLRPEDLARAEDALAQADVLLLQLEVPPETVEAALAIGRKCGVRAVLDPAPALVPFPPAFFDVEVLCPNATEAEAITGLPVADEAGARQAARLLCDRGVRHAVVTLGARGAVVCDREGVCRLVPGFPVTARDTTAAGDAFAAGVGVGLAEGRTVGEAVRLGCAAGGLAVTRRGAQQAMPDRAEVERLLGGTGQTPGPP